MRQSSSLSMIPFLLKRGAKVTYYDPSGEKKEFSKLKNILFCNNVNDACKNVDLVIIHTEWEEFKALDFNKLYRKKKFKIYDMRNLYSVELMKKKGFNYYSIGRQNSYISNIASISTAAPSGKEFALIATLACLPLSPNTADKVSEAGFITLG